MAGDVLTFRIASYTKLTISPSFQVTIQQDCSTEENSELDSVFDDWLYSLAVDTSATNDNPENFTVTSPTVLYNYRKLWGITSPETFQLRPDRTSEWCEINRPVRYTSFATDADPSSNVEFDESTAQFIIHWWEFDGAGTHYITTWITIENDDGLSV